MRMGLPFRRHPSFCGLLGKVRKGSFCENCGQPVSERPIDQVLYPFCTPLGGCRGPCWPRRFGRWRAVGRGFSSSRARPVALGDAGRRRRGVRESRAGPAARSNPESRRACCRSCSGAWAATAFFCSADRMIAASLQTGPPGPHPPRVPIGEPFSPAPGGLDGPADLRRQALLRRGLDHRRLLPGVRLPESQDSSLLLPVCLPPGGAFGPARSLCALARRPSGRRVHPVPCL